MSISEINIPEAIELPDDKPEETVQLSSVEEIMGFIGKGAARVIKAYPIGVDHDDIKQEVARRLIEKDGGLGPIYEALQKERAGEAITRVRSHAIDAAREFSEPGSSVFVRTVGQLERGEPVPHSRSPLGQAARRRAYMHHEGTQREANEFRDEFGTPKGSIFEDPEERSAYQEMLNTLMEGVPNLQGDITGKRNRELVQMYILGYSLPEIAEILGIPAGTAKSIWWQFKKDAKNILQQEGYCS